MRSAAQAAGVPEDRREYQSKTALALEMLERAQARGHLEAQWVAGDTPHFGMSPTFRDGLAAAGMQLRPGRAAGYDGLAVGDRPGPIRPIRGNGRPRKPRLRGGQRQTMQERAAAIPADGWREITVAEGSQGPCTYRYSGQRVRPTHQAQARRNPLGNLSPQNLDGSEPRYYLSNAPEETPLETLAYVGGSRWRIETEFETEKSDVGLDEYETRTWAGWHHHVTMCLLAGAFLLTLQQGWGEKDASDHPTTEPAPV